MALSLTHPLSHVNMVGYSGFVPTSLFNSEYSRYARAAPEDLTSTARTHRCVLAPA
jgi:hypothetical protein